MAFQPGIIWKVCSMEGAAWVLVPATLRKTVSDTASGRSLRLFISCLRMAPFKSMVIQSFAWQIGWTRIPFAERFPLGRLHCIEQGLVNFNLSSPENCLVEAALRSLAFLS